MQIKKAFFDHYLLISGLIHFPYEGQVSVPLGKLVLNFLVLTTILHVFLDRYSRPSFWYYNSELLDVKHIENWKISSVRPISAMSD